MATGPIQYEGLREIYTALRDLEPAVHDAVKGGLLEAGTLTRDEAASMFVELGGQEVSPAVRASHEATAEGFKVRVRTSAVVEIAQTKPRTTGQHPEYGSEMMTKALLPARTKTLDPATAIVEDKVVRVLRAAGF